MPRGERAREVLMRLERERILARKPAEDHFGIGGAACLERRKRAVERRHVGFVAADFALRIGVRPSCPAELDPSAHVPERAKALGGVRPRHGRRRQRIARREIAQRAGHS